MIVYTSKGIIDSDELPSGTPGYINSGITEKEYNYAEKYIPNFNLSDVPALYEKLSTYQPPYEKGLFMAYNHPEIGISLSFLIIIAGYLLIKKS